jgi:hypothetical protein
MRRVFRQIRRAERSALVPLFAVEVIFGLLVSAICTVLFAADGSSDMTSGMTFSAAVAVIPFFVGLSVTVQHSVVERAGDFRSLRALGVSERRIRRSVQGEVCAGALLAGVVGGVLGSTVLRAMVSLLYGDLGGAMPAGLPSPLLVGASAAAVVAVLGLSGTARAVRAGLRKKASVGEPVPRRFWGVGIWSWIFLVLTIAAGVTALVAPRDAGAVYALVYIVPFTMAGAAPVVLMLWLTVVEKVSRRFSGWSPLSLAARESVAVPSAAVFAIMILFICFPLALFTSDSAWVDAARTNAEHRVSDVSVVTGPDGDFLDPAWADEECWHMGDNCTGTVSWAYGRSGGSADAGFTPSDGSRATDYVLTGSDRALTVFVSGDVSDADAVVSPFSQPWMVPWETVDSDPGFVDARAGSFIVLAAGAGDVDSGVGQVLGAKDAMHGLPEDTFYGPNGTGTSEIIPLFASVILGGSVLVFGLLLGRQRLYGPMLSSLRGLGMTRRARKSVQICSNLLLSIGALITCFVFGIAAYSVMLTTFGPVRIAVPGLPPGLVLYLVVTVVSATLLASFAGYGTRRRHSVG